MSTAVADTVTIDGRTLTPGEVFRPLADHPEYKVVFVRLDGDTITLADCCGSWSQPIPPKES